MPAGATAFGPTVHDSRHLCDGEAAGRVDAWEGSVAEPLMTRRFTVDEYYRMAQAGVLTEDDRVELIEGQIVLREPIGPYHAGTVRRLNRLWTTRLGARAVVDVQNPVRLGAHSEPQPDLVLLRPRHDFYADTHPEPADVLLAIEVGGTSAEGDRTVKMPLYARAGIREAWLIDLAADRVEVYRRPSDEGYRDVRRLGRDQTLSAEAFPDVTLTVGDLLG